MDHTSVSVAVENIRTLGYASERWCRIVAVVVQCDTDVRTLEAWAYQAGHSAGVIRAWCRAAGLSPKRSLDFARLLRVVVRNAGRPASPFELLDVADDRTMRRLLATGGIAPSMESWPEVATYLSCQRFIDHPALLEKIAAICVAALGVDLRRVN
jgi:hypothetical protein